MSVPRGAWRRSWSAPPDTTFSCFACVERCPRNVEPAKLVEAIRLAVIRQQGMNHMTAGDLPGKLDDKIPQQALVSAMRKYSK